MSDNKTNEIWRPIKGFEGSYEVSNMGRVRSLDRIQTMKNRWGDTLERLAKGKLLAPIDKAGYQYVGLRDGHSGKTIRPVHQLVLEAFECQRPPKCECNHKNGDKADNRLENLEWASHARNIQHRIETLGISNAGSRHGMAKLTDSDIETIRSMRANGAKYKDIAAKLGVSAPTVCRIVNGSTWQHVGPSKMPGSMPKSGKKLTKSDIKQILAGHARGESAKNLAARFGVTPYTVWFHVRKSRFLKNHP